MKFTVYGEPRAKGRPRFSTYGGFVRTYTDKATLNYENLVKMSYIESCGGEPITYHDDLEMEINIYVSIPKSAPKYKQKMMIDGDIRPLKKPDIDNCIKSILDGLNKVAFDDDKQIVRIVASKWYSETPRVEVEIE